MERKNHKNGRVIIVSGGTLNLEVVKREIQQGTYIIGVDRGAEFLDRHGIMPDYVVGDFDSISPEVIQKYKQETQIPVRAYNPVKDASDTEIALQLAMETGYKEILILGATGSRVDHMLANLQILSLPFGAGIQAWIMDEYNKISIIPKTFVLEEKNAYGKYFSLFSLGGVVEGLTLSGAKYNLSNHTLIPNNSLSVSNQFIESQIKIQYESGTLLFIESRD